LIELPEGWFISHDEIAYDVLNPKPLRKVMIQNGTTPGISKAYIGVCEHIKDKRIEDNKLQRSLWEILQKDGYIA
jgi:hypothetical protein